MLCSAKFQWGLVLVDVSCGNGSVPIGHRTMCCLLVTREFWDPMLQIYYNLSIGRTCHHKWTRSWLTPPVTLLFFSFQGYFKNVIRVALQIILHLKICYYLKILLYNTNIIYIVYNVKQNLLRAPSTLK